MQTITPTIPLTDLSKRVRIDRKNLRNILRGRTDPRLSTYEAIVNALGYDLTLTKRNSIPQPPNNNKRG